MTRPIARLLLASLVGFPLACGMNDAPPTAPVLQDLKLACSAAPIAGTAPLLVQFFATPSGGNGVHAVTGSFGDGGVSNDANPAYTRPGTYTAASTRTPRPGAPRRACGSPTATPATACGSSGA